MVQHYVAIRTDRPEIANRINLVGCIDARQGIEVVNMDDANHKFAVALPKSNPQSEQVVP